MSSDTIPNEDSSASSEMPWLSDDEFLQKDRVTRSSSRYVLDLIKDNSVFYNKRKQQAPVSHQLMVFLKYVGTKGSGASNAI